MKLFPFKSKNEFYKSDLMLEIAPLNFNFLKSKCTCKSMKKGIASALVEAADKFRRI